jgi:hypothetical protein
MQIPIISRRGQVKPYGSIPRINWAHPVTAGLIVYLYDAGIVIDLVTGTSQTLNTGSVNRAGSPIGEGYLYGSGQMIQLPHQRSVDVAGATVPWTQVVASYFTTAPSGAAFRILAGSRAPTSENGPKFAIGGAGGNQIQQSFNDGNSGIAFTVLPAANTYQTWASVATGPTNALMYVNGVLDSTQNALSSSTFDMTPYNGAWQMSTASGSGSPGTFLCPYMGVWLRVLSAVEMRLLHDDPYCFLIYPEDEIFSLLVGGAGAPPSGTLDTTEAPDTAAFAGQLDGLGDVSWGVLTPRLRPSLGPAGRRIMPFSFDLPAVAPAEITGTFATTEAADVAAFNGQVVIAATFDTTEAPDVAAFNGTVAWTGTLATTEAQDVAAFNGTVSWTGTLATTEAQDVAVFVGSSAWTGTLATTEAPDVAAFNGTVAWTAVLATTEAQDVAAFNGSAAWTGTLATTEAQDVAAFNGQVVIAASLVVTEGQDVASFLGSGVGIDGTLATTEAADIAAFAGQVVIAATLATVEAADAAAFTGSVSWTGTLATTEAKDVMAFTGSAGWTGTLAVTEGTDVVAFAGQVRISAALAVTEAQDVAAFNGFLVAPLTGTLAVTEAQDIASFSGFLVFAGIVGTLNAVEQADGARFVMAQPPATPGDLQYGWPDVIVRRRL